MRLLLTLLLAPAACLFADPQPAFVHAVEFPYYLYPRQVWERELVWLHNIGVRTVAFSIPWNWHEAEAGKLDFNGETAPRRDLIGFLKTLRRLEMRAWARPATPVRNWLNDGIPAWAAGDRRAARRWESELERTLAPFMARHGGPIAFWGDESPPPQPVRTFSARDPDALAESRSFVANARGTLLWADVETSFWPAGWQVPGAGLVRPGAVSVSGEETPATASIRKNASLLASWEPILGAMRTAPARPSKGKFPAGVSAVQLVPAANSGPSAVSISNLTDGQFQGDLRVLHPGLRRQMVIPGVSVPARSALWLPVRVPLNDTRICRNCSVFSNRDHVVYATAELQRMEYENGLLSMEFAAPVAGEVILQLSRRPSGPFLAAGTLKDFAWDEATKRARLPVPAGAGASHRVRIGLAIEPPEQSAFLTDLTRIVIGRANNVVASFSSQDVASRSRLRVPEGFDVKHTEKSPAERIYHLTPPATAVHGEFINLELEADGVTLGGARVQLMQPATLRFPQAMTLHYGKRAEVPVDPPIIATDPRGSRNLEVIVRNHAPIIQSFTLEAAGKGVQFMPAKAEVTVGPLMDRAVSLRVFADSPGLLSATLKLSGDAQATASVRLISLPRNQTVAWAADLDGDGADEWVLENQRVRAVFSQNDGGRWLEFVSKDSGENVIPEDALAGKGKVAVQPDGSGLLFDGGSWKRTVQLDAAEPVLTIQQAQPPPRFDGGKPAGLMVETGPRGEVIYRVAKP